MKVQEFSDQFDILYNNITNNQAPGLNEYEKSVFLTKAQEEIVKNYFNPKANPKQDGFDDSPKRQSDFSTIISTATLNDATGFATFDANSYAFVMPEDLFISLNEQILYEGLPLVVVPISYEEYSRLMAKPYKYPPKYQAWRIITNNGTGTYTITEPGSDQLTISDDGITEYGAYLGLRIGMTTECTDKPVWLSVNVINGTSNISITEETGYHNVVFNVAHGTSLFSFKENYIDTNTDLSNYFLYLDWPDDRNAFAVDPLPLCGLELLKAQATTRTSIKKRVIAEIRGRFDKKPVYKIRYVKRPAPIILIQLTSDLSIQGLAGPSQCELPEELHEEILQRAVELAKVAWTQTGQENVQLVMQAGQRSE